MHCLGKYKLIYSSQLSECFVAHLLLPRASCISQYTDVVINSFSLGPTEYKAGLVQAQSLCMWRDDLVTPHPPVTFTCKPQSNDD